MEINGIIIFFISFVITYGILMMIETRIKFKHKKNNQRNIVHKNNYIKNITFEEYVETLRMVEDYPEDIDLVNNSLPTYLLKDYAERLYTLQIKNICVDLCSNYISLKIIK